MTGHKILYMEDQDEMIAGIKNFFESYGYIIKFVKEYNDGFERELKEYDPRIVIIDYDIEGNTFFHEVSVQVQMARRIHKKNILLIGCTAIDNVADISKEFHRQGFDKFVHNDGSEEKLKDMIAYINRTINTT